MEKPPLRISCVIPFLNEKENLPLLLQSLTRVLKAQNWQSEIVLIDDGSTDHYESAIEEFLKASGPIPCKLVKMRRNFGQTAATQAGFELSNGDIVVTMDADLQNDPEDIPKMIDLLEKGYDVVSGWRKNRKDPFFTRILPSVAANYIIRWVTNVNLHDFGCTLKVYRREILKEFRLYGEMHRFIPVHASWHGANIAEVEVSHHSRIHGTSKYGLVRFLKVILDLITVKFLGDFSTKPLYFFGGFGLALFFLSGCAVITTLVQKFVYQVWVHRNPMFLIAIFFCIVGVQLILIGLIAELGIRNYYESQSRKTYSISTIRGKGLES
jgi:glycosyltransferase involved in cell wall biosynthesis